jgi:hypothetical protein
LYSADFGLAARLAGSLLASGQIGCARTVPITAGLGVQGLLIGQPICLLDLALAHRSRTTRQLHIVVAGNRHRGHRPVTTGNVHENQHIRVVSTRGFIAGMQRLIDLLRQRLTVLVQPTVQAHQQNVLILAGRGRSIR